MCGHRWLNWKDYAKQSNAKTIKVKTCLDNSNARKTQGNNLCLQIFLIEGIPKYTNIIHDNVQKKCSKEITYKRVMQKETVQNEKKRSTINSNNVKRRGADVNVEEKKSFWAIKEKR